MDRQDSAGPVSSASVYRGELESTFLSGQVDLTIEAEGLLLETVFDASFLGYDSIRAIVNQGLSILIESGRGQVLVSRMGRANDEFFMDLCQAFNDKVQRIFQPKGPVLFEMKGPRYDYGGRRGQACIRVFSDCILLLPPNLDARRIPFVFVKAMELKDFILTLTLVTGEQYVFSQLGYDHEPFARIIRDSIKGLRQENAAVIQELDGSLGPTSLVEASRLLPEGLVVDLGEIVSCCPSTAQVLEGLLADSPIGDYYAALKTLADPAGLAVGFKAMRAAPVPEPEEGDEEDPALESGGESPDQEPDQEAGPVSAWALWTVIPSRDGQKAVTEFAFPKEKAATYVFRTDGDFDRFMVMLNRAFEATHFQREVLFLTDEQLRQERYANALMLLVRTPALIYLKERFFDRVIHRSLESWTRNLKGKLQEPIP